MNPIAKARALLADRERQEAEAQRWREDHADQILAAETDALLAKMAATKPVKQRDYGGVIYKTRDDALVQDDITDHRHSQPATHGRPMSPELQEEWNVWCDSRILHHIAEYNNKDLQKHFEEYSGIVGEEVVRIVEAARRDIERQQKQRIVLFDPSEAMSKEIAKHTEPLRDEITVLKKQITELKKRR